MTHTHPMNPSQDRRIFCPSLFRIVPALDGGICRVRLDLGRISPAQMHAVAEASGAYGNGIIELTNRANLQIRGIQPGTEAAVIAILSEAGLAPNDPAHDDVRNVLISPHAGIDPDERIDPEPLARAILDHLRVWPEAPALSAKFSILIDGGGSVGIMDHAHDLWLAAALTNQGTPCYRIGFAGTPGDPVAPTAPIFYIDPDDAFPLVAGMLDQVVQCQDPTGPKHRLKEILMRVPPESVLGMIEAATGITVARARARDLKPQTMPAFRPLGPHPQRQRGRIALGAMPFLGRLTPRRLTELADCIVRVSAGTEIRLTPWQGFIIPNCTGPMIAPLLRDLAVLDFITEPDDPRAALITCAGSPGCRSSHRDCKADAAHLVPSLPRGLAGRRIHLSGCAKGCAHRAMADLTLIARPDQTYDLHRPGPENPFGPRTRRAIAVADLPEEIGSLAADLV